MGYIVPSDAPSSKSQDFIEYLTSMDDIKALAKRGNAKHILFVFDSCFSGSVFRTRSSENTIRRQALDQIDQRSIQFITSGKEGEVVPGVSQFVPAFIAGILGGADLTADGLITGDELGMWISDQFSEVGVQTPQWGRTVDTVYRYGNFVFAPRSGDSAVGPVPTEPVQPNAINDPVDPNGDRSSAAQPFQILSDVDVIYFPRSADRGLVEAIFRGSGISYTTQPSKKTTASNVITCTPDVQFEDVKALAVRLVNGGVPIRLIVPQWHAVSNRVTVEHLKFADSYPMLTETAIGKLKSCPKRSDFYPEPSHSSSPSSQIPLDEPVVVCDENGDCG